MKSRYDLAIVGSGFGGSLLAMIARRLGRSVVLIERGTHPRFAIGESSTPLANLLLEEIARRYDLPRLLPLCKWGSWRRVYPDLAVGLKRGFSFYHHALGERFVSRDDRSNELLVAASPHDGIGDTHWYRPRLDEWLVGEAQSLVVVYQDHVQLERAESGGHGMSLGGQRNGRAFEIDAGFLIDASGPRGFLHRQLSLPEQPFADYPATEAIYAHFRNVSRMDEGSDFTTAAESLPFPPDNAAVHHVFEGGWVWVLRFNNGITSAGVAASPGVARRLRLGEGAAAWDRLLRELPSLQFLFRDAEAVTPFHHAPRLCFRASVASGERWAMLPSAAGVVDPLLSTGFPLTLLGVLRLTEIIDQSWEQPQAMGQRTEGYGRQSLAELDATAALVRGLYAAMNDFPLFTRLTLLYFAAASFAETARRLNRPASSFLLHDDPHFGPALRRLCEKVGGAFLDRDARTEVMQKILEAIEPIDVAGLGNPSRQNWYPARGDDLREAAPKLNATPSEIESLLVRSGFVMPAGGE